MIVYTRDATKTRVKNRIATDNGDNPSGRFISSVHSTEGFGESYHRDMIEIDKNFKLKTE